jgi:hypothetical protein
VKVAGVAFKGGTIMVLKYRAFLRKYATLLLTLAVCVLASQRGHADDPAEEITLRTNPRITAMMEAAADYVKAKDWDKAVHVLQQVLDRKEEFVIQVQRDGPGGGKTSCWVSARDEANRLIATLPAKGLDCYRARFEPKAREDFKAATAGSDPKRLAQVADRYLNTETGAKAQTMVAVGHLEGREYEQAASRFEVLLRVVGADKLETPTLFKATLAFRYVRKDKEADEIWYKFKPRIEKDGLRLDDGTVLSVKDAEEQIKKAVPPKWRSASGTDAAALNDC